MRDQIAEELRDLVRALQDDATSPFRMPTVLLSRACESVESRGERREFEELREIYEQVRVGKVIDRTRALGVAQRALDARNQEVEPDAQAELVRWPRSQ